MNKIEKAEKKLEKMKKHLAQLKKEEKKLYNSWDRIGTIIEKKEEEMEEFIAHEITWYKERPYELLSIEVLNLPKDIEKKLKKKQSITMDDYPMDFQVKTIEDMLSSSIEELLIAGFNMDEINIIRKALKKHNAYMDCDPNSPKGYDIIGPINWKD